MWVLYGLRQSEKVPGNDGRNSKQTAQAKDDSCGDDGRQS